MKKVALRLFGVLFILSLFASQNAFSQVDLSGKWTAMCVLEKTDVSSIEFCDLCPFDVSEDKSKVSFEPLKMDFGTDFSSDTKLFSIIVDDESIEVECIFNDELDTISFTYKEIEYVFQVLPIKTDGKTSFILKDKDGFLLFLQK